MTICGNSECSRQGHCEEECCRDSYDSLIPDEHKEGGVLMEWISVKEREPEEAWKKRLCYDEEKGFVFAYIDGQGWWEFDSDMKLYKVTHWAELLPPPTDEPK
jgi:hypothetical protein